LVPKPLIYALALLVPLAVMPFALVALIQARHSERPRIAPIQDMGNQPKLKAQALDPFFADRRAQRPEVPGTVARGQLMEDDFFYRGYKPGVLVPHTAAPATEPPGRADLAPGTQTATAPAPSAPQAAMEPAWYEGYPTQIKITEVFIRHGQERFNIYCAVCHGEAGYGDGMVQRRAMALMATGGAAGWTNPTNLHDPRVVAQPNGRIFNTITNGNPRGLMPPYGAQIPPEDRWAIIAYLRALQRSQAASAEDARENREQGTGNSR
jgi:mono/diheme cytochrome c family protein